MSKIVNGVETELTEAVPFNVVALGNVTLGTKNRRALSEFQRKVSELQSTVRAAGEVVSDLEKRLGRMAVAGKALEKSNSGIMEDIYALQSRIGVIKESLYGDRLASRLDIGRPPSISDRVNRAVYGMINTTSAPTQTHRDGYEIAKEEFQPILKQIQQIVRHDIADIENALDRAGAPYTPGRLPKMNDH